MKESGGKDGDRLMSARMIGRLLLFVVVVTSPALATKQRAPVIASPEDIVRQFYDWYLHAKFPDPDKRNMAKFRQYVTQRFLRRAINADANLFIDAQDADATWANGLSVSKATIHGQTATTEVTLTGNRVHYK